MLTTLCVCVCVCSGTNSLTRYRRWPLECLIWSVLVIMRGTSPNQSEPHYRPPALYTCYPPPLPPPCIVYMLPSTITAPLHCIHATPTDRTMMALTRGESVGCLTRDGSPCHALLSMKLGGLSISTYIVCNICIHGYVRSIMCSFILM